MDCAPIQQSETQKNDSNDETLDFEAKSADDKRLE